jgi:hypothetical protein
VRAANKEDVCAGFEVGDMEIDAEKMEEQKSKTTQAGRGGGEKVDERIGGKDGGERSYRKARADLFNNGKKWLRV